MLKLAQTVGDAVGMNRQVPAVGGDLAAAIVQFACADCQIGLTELGNYAAAIIDAASVDV